MVRRVAANFPISVAAGSGVVDPLTGDGRTAGDKEGLGLPVSSPRQPGSLLAAGFLASMLLVPVASSALPSAPVPENLAPRTKVLADRTAPLFATPNASSSARIELSTEELVVSELEPGSTLLWFAIGHERIAKIQTRIRREKGERTDSDGDGVVALRPEGGIPRLSVFALVDIEREEVVVAAPRKLRLRQVSGEAAQLAAGARKLLMSSRRLHALWFSPGRGIWYEFFQDGDERDEDGEPNGRIRASLTEFKPQYPPDKPPPERVRSGDFFVVVDERSLFTLVVEVE